MSLIFRRSLRYGRQYIRTMASIVSKSEAGIADRYENFIGGQFVAPIQGRYFENISPVDGSVLCEVPRSSAEDIDAALDAAHNAFKTWKDTSVTERSNILLKLAQITEDNLPHLARIETIDNGKPIRETTAADMPLAVDHFRYYAGCIRADEGSIAELDKHTVSVHVHEPLGVVGQIIPWNFPLLMAAWKLAPALAAGCCVVLKPAEQTPVSIMEWLKLVQNELPPGVLNVVHGFGEEAGAALSSSTRVDKLAFTGETGTGIKILKASSDNIIPVTLELGGKSPNVFFESVMKDDDAFLNKCMEGAAMFALNQGEVCTCPSRILVQESIAEEFTEKLAARIQTMKLGNPLEADTMIGAQASEEQYTKIQNYLQVGKDEGAKVAVGGSAQEFEHGGYYIQPTVFQGTNDMRVFQEEIFGPVASMATFKDEEEALAIANDTLYGLGAGVWTRDAHQAYQVPRAIQAGRVWVNCYHLYPAHAAFGGYKKSGIGRETHKMMLDHYRQTKNMLISYDKNALGFF